MVQKTKSTKKNRCKECKECRCKECRCKPCKCKEDIHCYKITCPSCNNKRKKSKRRTTQRGGFCPPCLIAPLITATGLGGAAFAVSKSSSVRTKNGKTFHTRRETYKMKQGDKTIKKVFKQDNNKIYLNNKELMPRSKSASDATKKLNKKMKTCIKSGFKKC